MTPRDCHILMYHNICPGSALDSLFPFVVSPAVFSRQLDSLVRRGVQAVTLQTLFDGIEGTAPLPRRFVVITFDDCAKHLLDHAVPELSRRGLTATFFVPTAHIGGRNQWDMERGHPEIEIMGGDDLAQLAAAGFEVGSHAATHRDLRDLPADSVLAELSGSRESLEDLVGRQVRFLAYPYGQYPIGYADVCAEAGYAAACGISSPSQRAAEDPYALRRVLVRDADGWLRFRLKLSGWYLRMLSRRDRRIPPGLQPVRRAPRGFVPNKQENSES